MAMQDFRIGTGYDVHGFARGRTLVLGGVEIPHHQGLAGHSDADVLLHAVCDALLGALGLGDIGEHFPDTDPRYKGISSLRLLEDCAGLMSEKGYEPVNLDCTLFAQVPRISPHKTQMKKNIATTLSVLPDRVNIKATTTEKLGFVGREEGICAACTLLLKPVPG